MMDTCLNRRFNLNYIISSHIHKKMRMKKKNRTTPFRYIEPTFLNSKILYEIGIKQAQTPSCVSVNFVEIHLFNFFFFFCKTYTPHLTPYHLHWVVDSDQQSRIVRIPWRAFYRQVFPFPLAESSNACNKRYMFYSVQLATKNEFHYE